ncbi:hypothetical protein LTR28_008918 [Elasticomyces elasticus]|nr:hypothetical protein LTR28_008918 [Elasticomyces elasticus]
MSSSSSSHSRSRSRSRNGLAIVCVVVLLLCLVPAAAASVEPAVGKEGQHGGLHIQHLTPAQIEESLQSHAEQECPLVRSLNARAHASGPSTPSYMTRLFTLLFPASPAINALLATLYISGPPNFLLALCPPNIDPNSLQVMVAFAVGGLLGDTLFHLLPEIFLGEPGEAGELRFKMIEPNRNLLLGVAIMIGFVTFVAMDKGLRIATGGQGHSHPHEHDEPSTTKDGLPAALTTAIGADKGVESDGFRQRKATGNAVVEKNMEKKEASTSTKMTAYLNLIADFTHNITDGLALSSSFYASPGYSNVRSSNAMQ